MIAQADLSPLQVTSIKTANYAARSGELVQCDASSGSFTVALPGSPRVNQIVGVKLLETTGGNSVTIARNGNAIEGEAGDPSLSEAGKYLELQYNGAGSWNVVGGYVSVDHATRELLTAARTYYVRTDGNDSNNGLTNNSGGAFLTIQNAVDVAASLDLGLYDVTIEVADGTYTTPVVLKSTVGSGQVIIDGNTATPANCLISTTSANCFGGTFTGRYTIRGFKVQTTTSGSGVLVTGANTTILSNIEFGACVTWHMGAFNRATIIVTSNYTISGNADRHWVVAEYGFIKAHSLTITLSGTRAFGMFALATEKGNIQCYSDTFSGSATGQRYFSQSHAQISTGMAGANYLPGNSAGSVFANGVYS